MLITFGVTPVHVDMTNAEVSRVILVIYEQAFYAEIRSVVETARRRSVRAIDAFRLTVEGRPIALA